MSISLSVFIYMLPFLEKSVNMGKGNKYRFMEKVAHEKKKVFTICRENGDAYGNCLLPACFLYRYHI